MTKYIMSSVVGTDTAGLLLLTCPAAKAGDKVVFAFGLVSGEITAQLAPAIPVDGKALQLASGQLDSNPTFAMLERSE